MLFIDFQWVHDLVNGKTLYGAVKFLRGISDKIIKLVRMTMEKAVRKGNGVISEELKVTPFFEQYAI